MKNTGNLSLAVAFATTMYAACTPPPPPPPPPGPAHFLVASSPSMGIFSVTGTSVVAHGAVGAKVQIDGTNAAGNRVSVLINPYSGSTGTISIVDETACIYYPTSSSGVQSVSGNITLTSTSPDIIGTFNYLGSDGNTVTGSFNVPAP